MCTLAGQQGEAGAVTPMGGCFALDAELRVENRYG